MKSKMIDFFSIILTVFLFLPFVYLTSADPKNHFSLILLILLSVPTIMAMVHGAPFVPTPMTRVRHMVKLANLKKGDRVYDIGCGDGRMVYIAANEYGAKATGFELSPMVYALARFRKLFWRSKAQIKFANFKTQSVKDADVIFCYLLPECFAKIEDKLIAELKTGARIVSYAFEIPYLKLVQKEEKDPTNNFAPIWIYEKP